MSEPEVVKCADGLYQHVIYSLSPYIADYPEQVLVFSIIQGWCLRYLFTATLLKSPTQALLRHYRCTSHKDDLKTSGIPRSKEHTDNIQEVLELEDL